MLYILFFVALPLNIFMYLKIPEFDIYWFATLFGIMAIILLSMGMAKYMADVHIGGGTVDILEVYDDGWVRCRHRGIWYPDIPPEGLRRVEIAKMKPKGKKEYYVVIIIVLEYRKGKRCALYCDGYIKVDELPTLFEALTYLQKIAASNRKRLGESGYLLENTPGYVWAEDKEWKKVKEERDRLRKEHGIPVDYARDVVYRW
jgi:hypothetical protein